MAITLDDSVASPAPLGRPVFYTVSSDDANIVRMKGTLNIDSDASIILDPDINDTNTFTFDFQKIIERNLKGYLSTIEGGHDMPAIDSFTVFEADEAFKVIQATFVELVSTATGGLIDGANLVTSSKFVLNSFLPRHESQVFNKYDLGTAAKKFLTNNSPADPLPITNRRIKLTHNAWLSVFVSTTKISTFLKVVVTDTNNVVTTSYITVEDIDTFERSDVPVGPININQGTVAAFSEGVQPLIGATTKSYTVTIIDLGPEQVANGDFSSDPGGWDLGVNWDINAGTVINAVTATGDIMKRALTLSTSTNYVIEVDLVSHVGPLNVIDIEHDDINILSIDADADGNGTHGASFTTASSISNADIEVIATNISTSIELDNLSIKEAESLSETITFIIDNTCADKPVHFYWENRLGGLDDYEFQSEQRSIAVNKKTYTKPLTKDFAPNTRGETTLGGESNTPFQAFTNPLRDNELIWLEELFEDRNTFILVDSKFIPVVVTRSSAPTANDQRNQLRVDYIFANNRIILGK